MIIRSCSFAWHCALLAVGFGGALLCPRPSGAQEPFEGIVTTTSTADGERMTSKVWIKGERRRMDSVARGNQVTMIIEPGGRFITLLDPQRQYYVMEVPPAEADEMLDFQSTGGSETVAGQSCRYYGVRDPANPDADGGHFCVASGFGFVGLAGQGLADLGSVRLVANAALRRQFAEGFLVLKALDPKGNVYYEVGSIERVAVSDAQLTPPAGYTELRMPGDASRRP